jgi:TRAP-type C4-dicarboxylate transport system substrate-binding protein
MLSATGAALAQSTIVIRGAHTTPEKEAQAYTWREFKTCIEKVSNGQVKMEIFPGGMMGSDLDLVDKVSIGALQMGHASTSNLASVFKDFEVFELPFLAENVDDNLKFFYRDHRLGGPITDRFQKQFEARNLRLFWVSPLLARVVHNSKRPVKVPADMKGMKIRVTASKIERDDILGFGGNPVTMGYAEVYTALAQGTIDGIGLPLNSIPSANAWETLKYTTIVPFNGFFVPAFINKDFYDSLPEQTRQQMDECAYDAVEYSLGLWKKLDADAIPQMEEHGMQIYKPTAEEYQKWKDALKGVYDAHAANIDKDWLATIEAAKSAAK